MKSVVSGDCFSIQSQFVEFVKIITLRNSLLSGVKLFLQFVLCGLQIALSERTTAKDCAHHFLIATSKLLQYQIQAANSLKLHSPDTERGKKRRREKGSEGEKKNMSRHGERRRRVFLWRAIVSAALKRSPDVI